MRLLLVLLPFARPLRRSDRLCESLIAVLPATTGDTFSGMQLKERPGPAGPYAAPDEIAPPRPDVSTGGTRYADIEYARVMGFRPLRMDLLLPPGPSGARYR